MTEVGHKRKYGGVRFRVRCDSGQGGEAKPALLGLRERWQVGCTDFGCRAVLCRSDASVARRIPQT